MGGRGSAPNHAGELRALPQTPSWWAGGVGRFLPSTQEPRPLSAFGAVVFTGSSSSWRSSSAFVSSCSVFFADFYFRDSYFSAEIGQISLMSDAFRSTFGRRTFAVAGPTAWKSFPDNLRDPDVTTDNFKRLLKTFLFSEFN